MHDAIYEICYSTMLHGGPHWGSPVREFFADRDALDERLHRLYVERISSHGPNYRPANDRRSEYSYPGVRHRFHYVREISVTDATVTPLEYLPEEQPKVRQYADSEVHIIVTSDGSYDWTTDPDSFVEFETEVLDDERPRGPVVWHALVYAPGWLDDYSDLAIEIIDEFVYEPRRRGEHVDLLGPWRDGQN